MKLCFGSSVHTTIESRPTNLSSSPNLFVQISAAEMGDELTSLLAIFKKVEESGGQATLSVTTKSGVTKTKLELVSPPSTPATATTSSPAAPAPGGQRRRRRGPAARMKVNARAAQHRATLAGLTTPPATGDLTNASLCAHLPAQRPLHIHPSPVSDSGQRQVISVGRKKVPAHSFLNLDGSTLPPPSSLRSTTARSTINTTVTPWAPPLPINTTANTPHHSDPQVAARLHACGLCRAGACLPAICDYRPTT